MLISVSAIEPLKIPNFVITCIFQNRFYLGYSYVYPDQGSGVKLVNTHLPDQGAQKLRIFTIMLHFNIAYSFSIGCIGTLHFLAN